MSCRTSTRPACAALSAPRSSTRTPSTSPERRKRSSASWTRAGRGSSSCSRCARSPRRKRGKKMFEVRVDPAVCLGEKCGCNRLCTRIFRCPGLVLGPGAGRRGRGRGHLRRVRRVRLDLSLRRDHEKGGRGVKPGAIAKDPYNVIITGVGGQGNVLASRMLGNILSDKGYFVTIGETFGVSQRGGVRHEPSPHIGHIGMEPADTARAGGHRRGAGTDRGNPRHGGVRERTGSGPEQHPADLPGGGHRGRDALPGARRGPGGAFPAHDKRRVHRRDRRGDEAREPHPGQRRDASAPWPAQDCSRSTATISGPSWPGASRPTAST